MAGADLRRDAAVELLGFLDTGRGGLKAGVLRLAGGFARSISQIVMKTFATGYFSIAIVEEHVVASWWAVGKVCKLSTINAKSQRSTVTYHNP